MLDVILDCLGALLLFGQAAWFLASGRIEDIAARDGRPTDVWFGHDRAELRLIRDPHSLHLCLRPDV